MDKHARFIAALATLGWGGEALAKQIGTTRSTVFPWTTGTISPSDELLAWLEMLAAHRASHPPPPTRPRGRPIQSNPERETP